MCGIFGYFTAGYSSFLLDKVNLVHKLLIHRGPDSHGLTTFSVNKRAIALGQTRLSIIDLTSGGLQPMTTPDGRYTIVFNGEIYNYQELRAELQLKNYIFSSDSDTEVLLAAWAIWGPVCLRRLVGMFAFVILDRHSLTMTCVRDAFGIKPFYYVQDGSDFLFGSEVHALFPMMPNKPKPNWQRSYDYLVHGSYDNNNETFFDGVHQLQPGHLLVINFANEPNFYLERWWVPRLAEYKNLKFNDATEYLREKFLESIRIHLRSDVPLGVALSGGLDSSSIVCALRYVSPELPIHTFSYIASGSSANEEKWVDHVNHHVGAVAHKVLVTPQELAFDLDDMIRAQGEPFGSMSIYAQYRVFHLAKKSGITVTLDGQGADEMLGGYIGFPGERVRSLLDEGHPLQAFDFLSRWSRWPGRSFVMGLKAALAECTNGVPHELLRMAAGLNKIPDWINNEVVQDMGLAVRVKRFRSSDDSKGRRMIAQMINMQTRHGLPGLLRHGDRNSMRFSVESRVPFLTLDQVEFALSLPEHYLVSQEGETKHIFRRAMKGIVPDEILMRKDKIGFEPPEKEWLINIADQAREWLSEDINIPFIRRGALLAEFDAVIEGRRPFTWQVWRWINFYRWKACVAD
jgi:asparagine synthase (glutamine-hydrolysing)